MSFDTQTKLAIYRHFAETGQRPSLQVVAERVRADASSVREAYGRLRAERVLVLEPDGVSIRMAPPFSGVPTQHVVIVDETKYFANCAWDSFGIPAALQRPGRIHSRCEQSALTGDWFRRSTALQLAFSLPCSRGQVVGRHCFHLKQHAFLPVGRTGSGVVRRAWLSHAAARHHGPAMGARDYLVFDALKRELAAPAARGDVFHFRRARLRRRLLGSAVG